VTVTVNDPAVEPVTVKVAVPLPVTLVGLIVAVIDADDAVAERLTTPLKPFRPVMVIVDVPEPGAGKLIEVGFALIVKSWTVNDTLAV
jgi:hypothetical protein